MCRVYADHPSETRMQGGAHHRRRACAPATWSSSSVAAVHKLYVSAMVSMVTKQQTHEPSHDWGSDLFAIHTYIHMYMCIYVLMFMCATLMSAKEGIKINTQTLAECISRTETHAVRTLADKEQRRAVVSRISRHPHHSFVVAKAHGRLAGRQACLWHSSSR